MIGPIDATDIMRSITSKLQTPVVFLLLVLAALTIFLLGSLIGEFFISRLYILRKAPSIPQLIEAFHSKDAPLDACIEKSALLKSQKKYLLEITKHPDLTDAQRESMAVRMLTEARAVCDRRTRISDLIAKVGPMLGLMGTLIPLGPGIIALGQGDTFTLSNSLLVAFDTTVTGLFCAAAALLISLVRKVWYRNDLSVLETLMECILEEEKTA